MLQTGCAAGVAVRPPIVVEARRLPMPPPPSRPAPRPLPLPPPPKKLSAHEAVALGKDWCHFNGYACRLDDVELKKNKRVWKVEFDAYRDSHRGRGKGHAKGRGKGHRKHSDDGEVKLEFDAFNGRLLKAKTDF